MTCSTSSRVINREGLPFAAEGVLFIPLRGEGHGAGREAEAARRLGHAGRGGRGASPRAGPRRARIHRDVGMHVGRQPPQRPREIIHRIGEELNRVLHRGRGLDVVFPDARVLALIDHLLRQRVEGYVQLLGFDRGLVEIVLHRQERRGGLVAQIPVGLRRRIGRRLQPRVHLLAGALLRREGVLRLEANVVEPDH